MTKVDGTADEDQRRFGRGRYLRDAWRQAAGLIRCSGFSVPSSSADI
jgi:hypothetical protein